MIEPELQAWVDKKLAPIMKRLEALESEIGKGPLSYGKIAKIPGLFRESIDQSVTTTGKWFDPNAGHPKPAEWSSKRQQPSEWSNHEEPVEPTWSRLDKDTLLNRYRIRWKLPQLNERHMEEIQKDKPDLYAEVVSQLQTENPELYARIAHTVSLEHEQESPEGTSETT